jgi:proline dehydrogenase
MADFNNLGKRLWQRSMIWLACSGTIKKVMQGNPLTAALSRRFVGRHDSATAAAKATELAAAGIKTSIFYLGEYVTDPATVDVNVQQIIKIVEVYGRDGLELFLSVDPSQIGYVFSDEQGLKNALQIGQMAVAQPTTKFVMLDMEDHSYVDKTIELYWLLREKNIPVAITLQAYLHRTENDARAIIAQGGAIRLVKGAFVEGKDIAFTQKQDIDASFLRLSEMMLSPEAKARGVYPIFATHDEKLIDAIKSLVKQNDWLPDQYEFEMLLGVRQKLQRQLVQDGYPLRVYVPVGKDWWPYTARRIGERPGNFRFLVQALLAR